MKATAITLILSMGLLLVPSCANMTSVDSVPASSLGSSARVLRGTVVSARSVQVQASSEDKNLGTGLGAALGAGAGSLLGRGKGQLVSTVGFGVLGAMAGRAAGSQLGKISGQELIIRVDGSRKEHRVTQPVYKQYGVIPVGTHGTLELGSGTSKFLPDSY